MINFVESPKSIKKSFSNNRDFSLCPSDYRKFKYDYVGLPLSDYLVKSITGREIGSNVYIAKTKYRFLKTRNITYNFLLDKEFCETCGNVDSIKPIKDSFFIAKDGGGDGLGDISYYDEQQYDPNDYISSGILNIKPKDEYKYFLLAILKSDHFKCFIDTFTKKGSTIRHSKKLSLEYKVPYLEEETELINDISEKMKSICENEISIRNSFFKVNQIINRELVEGKDLKLKVSNKISSLKSNNFRMDSGMYTDEFTNLYHCVKNYHNGCFNVELEKIKSGNTPEVRVINEKAKFVWVTPTDIQTNGVLNVGSRISMNTQNNITNNCLLIINRGDKYDVGISMFYDFDFLGNGHHNQGIYRIDCFDSKKLITMSAYLNSQFCRKLCKCISYGTKMREMKSIDFSKLLFPNFGDEVTDEIYNLYYDPNFGINTKGNENVILKRELKELINDYFKKVLSSEE